MSKEFVSVTIYVILGLFVIYISNKAKKSPRLCFWTLVLSLSLLAGFRSYYVGVDSVGYYEIFNVLESGYKTQISNVNEPGFLFLSFVLIQIFGNYTSVFLTISFATNYLIIKRLFDERTVLSLPIAMYIYYCQYYFMTLNTIRQWIAIAIIFYFSKYIGQGKNGNFIFFLSVVTAMLFHRTSLICLFFFGVYYLSYESKKSYIQFAKVFFVLLSPVAISLIYVYFFANYGEIYGVVTPGSLSLINVFRIILVFLLAYLLYKRNVLFVSRSYQTYDSHSQKYYLLLYLIGCLITLGVLFIDRVDRLGLFFMVFELLVLPRYAKESWSKQFISLVVVVLFAYLRIMSFISNGYGELPYIPFWSN